MELPESKYQGASPTHGGDFRSYARYALELPVRILCGREEFHGVTENVSANGVLFRVNQPVSVGMEVEFLLEVPESVLGDGCGAAAHCAGKIIRSYKKGPHYYAAAIIEEYSFQ